MFSVIFCYFFIKHCVHYIKFYIFAIESVFGAVFLKVILFKMLHSSYDHLDFKLRVSKALDLIKYRSVSIRMACSVYALNFEDANNMYNYIKINF